MKKLAAPSASRFLAYFLLIAAAVVFCPAPFTGPSFAETKKVNNVTFNFVDVDLPVVIKFISEITGKNFIFDEKIKGKVTIIAPTKLSADDAYSLFTSVLELKGFTVVPSGVNAYKVVPAAEAKQSGMRVSTEGMPVNENYQARLLPLKYISSEDALKFLQPLVSKDGHISTFGPGNMLLVVDSGLNIDKIISILDVIDRPSVSETPEVIPLKYANAETIAKTLNDGLSKTKTTRTAGPPGQSTTAEAAFAAPDQRLNAVILFGDRGSRESMKALISLLDVPSPAAQGRVNVYFLENADATELAKVLEGMIKGTQSQTVRQQGGPAAAAQVTPFEAAGGITITADKASNSLVVVASPADYQNLLQVIKQLDRRRRQVYVEAMIMEATIDRLRDLGVQWRAAAQKDGKPIFIGGFGTIDAVAIQGIIQGLQGASAGGIGNIMSFPLTTTASDGTVTTSTFDIPGFAALFSLNEFKDAVNVLSTPQILTSDNKEAEILVGENVPFISQSQTSVSTAITTGGAAIPGVLNSIVRQDVGIILRITPQITEGDHVKLDIYQEISSVKNQSDTITVSVGPTITKRSTKTSVVVRDNQIVVIGGLMQETDEEIVNKMPFLGDIPVLGWLFKTKSTSKNKTNLIVFLNPHVIKGPERLAEITADKQKEFAVANQQYSEGDLLVKFKDSVPPERAAQVISEQGASVLEHMEKVNIYHLKLKKGQTVERALKDFSALPEVLYAEPNYSIKMK